MSLYKMIVCDTCQAETKMGPESLDWFVLGVMVGGLYFASMNSPMRIPEQAIRHHVCPNCATTHFRQFLERLTG